jgi:inosine-uridine nucleoside N-ribohydrolase
LDGPTFPTVSKTAVKEKAIGFMHKVISSQKRKVTIVGTAALTNIALLLTVYPELIETHIEHICIMGGAIGQGNTSCSAEFNIECDAEAAKIVFESGCRMTMIPLEVTHTALVTQEIVDRLQKMKSPFGNFLAELLLFFKESYSSNFGFPDPPLHDPCAIAYLINPKLFETRLCRVDVDLGPYSYGRTNVDVFNLKKGVKNVTVGLKMNVKEFWNLMFLAFEDANKVSILNKI